MTLESIFPSLLRSVESWDMAEPEDTEDRDWPELLSDMSGMVGGAGLGAGLPRLKRGQGSRHLGVDMTLNPDDEDATGQRNKFFTSSGNTIFLTMLLNLSLCCS